MVSRPPSSRNFNPEAFEPFLHFSTLCAHFVAVNAEPFLYVRAGEGGLYVFNSAGQPATLMGGEGNDGFTFQVVPVVLEERKHHLWVGAPPDWAADENGVVGRQVNVALVRREFAIPGFFLREVD